MKTINKKLLIFFLLISISRIAFSQEILGSWYGQPDLGGIKLRIVFNISETDDGYFATMDSPDQNVKGILVDSVNFADNRLFIRIDKISLTYNGVLEEGIIKGELTQFGRSFSANLDRKSIQPNRPQTPQPPFPYISEDVIFRNEKDSIILGGTLTLPQQSGEYPAVILISGSGQQNRNEEIFEHKPFMVLADYLTRKGIAVLRYDDRGVGESTGDPALCTTADFATDTKAALEYLKSRKEINKRRIGLIGHSEGALIAFMLAARNKKDIAFIVSMGGSAQKGDSIILDQREMLFKTAGESSETISADRNRMRKAFALLNNQTDETVLKNKMKELFSGSGSERNIDIMVKQLTSPWMRYFLNYNPAIDLRRLKCPVFAINGEKDLQVEADANLNLMQKYIKRKLTVKKYPNLNHLFQNSTTGLPIEYGQIEETISNEVLSDIADWILNVVKQ